MAGIEETYPAFAPRIMKAREAGFSDAEINEDIRGRIHEATRAGFSVEEIQKEVSSVGVLEGIKRSVESGVQELGRSLLSTYKSLDPDQAKSAFEAGTAPLIAPLVASPPGVASIALGETTRKGAEQLGASPDLQAGLATVADFAAPGAFVPKVARGVVAKAVRPRARTIQELIDVSRQAEQIAKNTDLVAQESAEAFTPSALVPKKLPPPPFGIQPRGATLAGQPVRRTPVEQIAQPVPPDLRPALRVDEIPRSQIPIPERLQRAPIAPEDNPLLKRKPKNMTQGTIKDAVARHVDEITDTPAPLEFKGKEYQGAIIEGKKLRLKNDPDKVLSNPKDMLLVEETIPFDVPTETPAGSQAGIKAKAGGRTVKELLESQEGSIRLGPLRIRDGKPVESPTVNEIKEAVDQITKGPSSLRLTAGGLGEESTKTLSKTMGDEGAEMGRLAKAVRNDSEIEAGKALQPLRQLFKTLGDEQKSNLVEVLDKGAAPMDAATKAAATQVRAALDTVASRAQEVNLQIRLPNGDKIPFQPRGNYFPHMFGKELGEVVRTEKGRAMAKAQIKAQMSVGGKTVTDAQVEKALQAMLRQSKTRYGHLEMARQFDFGDYSKDPSAVLSRYFHDAYRRINIAEKFGPDLEKGEGFLTSIGMNRGDEAESFARNYFKKVTGTEEPGNTVVKRAVNAATNFQAGSKLSQAVLSNISQPVYTAVVTGAKNAVKGYYKSFTKEGRIFAERTGAILDDTLSDFMKDAGTRTDNSVLGKFADNVLKWTGFTASERMNRIVSANAGRYFANETLEKLLKNPESKGLRRALEKMNINVDDAIGRGELTELEQLRAGQSIVNRTQFKTDVTEIPLFWSSDAGRLITQFKKFQFKSGQMVKDEILAEMARGNVKPFLRAAALLPAAGVAVAKLRDSVRFGQQTERERNVADYLATVGTFGAFTDAFASSSKQPVRGLEYLAGPTLGDSGRAWEAAAGLAGFFPGGAEGEWRPAAKLLSRQIPVVGPSVRQLFNDAKPKSEKTKTLEELGLKRSGTDKKKLMKDLGLQ